MRYDFIKVHQYIFAVRNMCRMMRVHRSGFYAWIKRPKSSQQKDNDRLLVLIKQFWLESGGVYGYRKIHQDLCEVDEQCGKNRVTRLMKQAGLKAQVGYKKPRPKAGKPASYAVNHLKRQFNPHSPNQAWVTDITYIRTYEEWLYLSVVIDLYSRQIVGWSMRPQMTVELVLNSLLMALWRRKPKSKVLIHSDQGSQYTSHDWFSFLKAHNLVCSMSKRGNSHDNAVAESFFQLLKRERIKRRIDKDRETARQVVFNYIEMFYNPVQRYGYNENLSLIGFAKKFVRDVAGSNKLVAIQEECLQ